MHCARGEGASSGGRTAGCARRAAGQGARGHSWTEPLGAAVAAAPGQRTKESEGPFLLRAGRGVEEPKPRHPWGSRGPPLPHQVSTPSLF